MKSPLPKNKPVTACRGIAFLTLVFMPVLALAGIWEPDPDRVFVLDVVDIEVYEVADSDERWTSSLIANLEKKGGMVKTQAVLARTSARLAVNDVEVDAEVFQHVDEPEIFLVIRGRYWFYVDFNQRKIKLVGEAATPSLHYPPSRNFVVALNGFSGLPVRDAGNSPSFEAQRVSWY